MFLLFVSIKINAQYVTVRDFWFQSELKSRYWSCFDTLGRLDTTCQEILATTKYVSLYSYAINIKEFKYFKNLDTLIFLGSDLKSIDKFPPKLKYIRVRGRLLTEFPDDILYNLKYLNING